MSKIAEKRVKELGHSKDPFSREEFTANDIFDYCVECYDQAMQDFLEKAEEFFDEEFFMSTDKFEQFKNYMQNESKN